VRSVAACIALLAACGRIGFEPTGDPSGSAVGDGAVGSGDADKVDGMPTACQVRATPAGIGTISSINTCSGRDDVDACGGSGTQEVLFSFIPPSSGPYAVAAFDAGTQNLTMAAVGYTNAACTAIDGFCAGSLTIQLTGGTMYYVAVEAGGTSCALIDLDIRPN
jgi:hypothetical protein